MPTSAQLNLIINSSQVSNANITLQQFNNISNQTQQGAEKLNLSFGNLIKTITQLTGVYSLVQTVQEAFSTAATEDRLQKGFDNLTQSVSQSTAMLNELMNVSRNSQFSLAALGDAARQFMGLGLGSNQSIKLVEDMAQTLQNLGSGSDQLSGVANSLARILEEGQSNLYVFRSLSTQGIPAVKDVADTLGISFQRAMYLLRNGALDANATISILQYSMEKFNASAINTTPTLTQAWASLSHTISLGLGDVVKSLLDGLGAKGGLAVLNEGLTQFFHTLSDAIRILEGLPPQFDKTSESATKLAGIIKVVTDTLMILVAIKIMQWAADLVTSLFSLIKYFSNLGLFTQAAVVALTVLAGIEIGRWAAAQYPDIAKLAAALRLVASLVGNKLQNVGEWIADQYMGNVTVGNDAQNAADRAQHASSQDAWDQFDKTMQQINSGNLGAGQDKSFFSFVGDDIKKMGESAKNALGPIRDLMKFMEVPNAAKQGNYFGDRPDISTTLPENALLQLQKMIDDVNEKSSIIGLMPDAATKQQQLDKMKEVMNKFNLIPGDFNSAQDQEFLTKLSQAIDKLQGLQTLNTVAKDIGSSFANSFGQFITGAKNASQAAKDFVQSVSQMLLKDLVLKNIASLIETGITGLGTGLAGAFGGNNPSYNTNVTSDNSGAMLNTSVNFAMGGAFWRGIRFFAGGDVVNGPTMFNTAGGLGMMGEAGPEAIMPLVRGPNGKLGVTMHGGGGSPVVVQQHYWNIQTPNVDSFKRSQGQLKAMMQRSLR